MGKRSMYILFAVIVFAYSISTSFGLYLGQGGVVRSSNPRHQITSRTGLVFPGYPSAYIRNYVQRAKSQARPSGRIVDYGVVYGKYQPARYAPGPGIVGK